MNRSGVGRQLATGILVAVLAAGTSRAQEDTSRIELSSGTIRAEQQPDAQSRVVDESQWPDPTVTLLKSMVVPGWGQITNHRYVKAVFAIGLESWFLTGLVVNNAKAKDALDKYRETAHTPYFDEYQFYWGQRSDFMWLFGLTVFVSMFDAYVDAHLRPYENDNIPGVEPPKGLEIVVPF